MAKAVGRRSVPEVPPQTRASHRHSRCEGGHTIIKVSFMQVRNNSKRPEGGSDDGN